MAKSWAMIDTRKPHPTTNPGERAYLAYWQAWPAPLALPWHKLTQHERNAWQHVARTLTQGRAPRQSWPPPERETPR